MIFYSKDEALRPMELAKKQIIIERRLILDDSHKRKIIEDRIKRRIKLCREEDIKIIASGIKTEIKMELLIRKQIIYFDPEDHPETIV